jgi:hypothetical protein
MDAYSITRATYRDMLRRYADLVRNGTADSDLSPRQRRLTAVIVATASNDARADIAYPPTDWDRDTVTRAMGDALWTGNARALLQAVGPSADDDYSIALDRASAIVRGV